MEEKLDAVATIKKPWLVFYMMCFGWLTMMIVLGANTTAFPFLTAALEIDSSYVTWMSAAYTLGAAVLAPLMGRLGDLLGIKKIYVLGLVLFVISVLGLGLANHFAIVLIARLIQGLSVACVVPSCMAFAGRAFKGKEAAKGYAIFGAVSTGGNIVGPMVAGIFCSGIGYRWVYHTGAILNAVALILIFIVLPKIPVVPQAHGKFDFGGTITLFISIASLLILPTVGQQMGWTSPLAIACIVLFVVFMIAFVSIERKVQQPLIRLSLLKNRNFTIPGIYNLALSGVCTLFMYAVSYYVVGGLRMPSTLSGTWTTVTMAVMTVCAVFVSKLMAKVNWKGLAFLHVGIHALACVVFALVKINPVVMIFVGGVVLGLGSCFNTPLPSSSALADISPEERGVASGTFRLTNDFSGPLLTAIFIPFLSSIHVTAEGYPNFVESFPVVSLLGLIPVAIAFVICFFYPKHNPKADK